MRNQSALSFRDKQEIIAGEDRKGKILEYVSQADIVLLLVSPDFFASDECCQEMELVMKKRKEAGETLIIPILIRDTEGWQETPIGKFQPLPSNGKPLSGQMDRNKAMYEIAKDIRKAIEKRRSAPFGT